jgi:hypothetical protein
LSFHEAYFSVFFVIIVCASLQTDQLPVVRMNAHPTENHRRFDAGHGSVDIPVHLHTQYINPIVPVVRRYAHTTGAVQHRRFDARQRYYITD